MKNLLRITLLALITFFVISACAKQTMVAKRKYTKGYYISHAGKKPALSGKHQEIALKREKADVSDAPNEKAEKASAPDPNELIAESAIKQANALGQEQYKKHDKIVKKKSTYKAFEKGLEQVKRVERITGNKKISSTIQSKLSQGGDAAGEVLSLFWIVILVVLLLYLLGLLFDGFGLGWAIHLLALVVLIMLILWLLRVV